MLPSSSNSEQAGAGDVGAQAGAPDPADESFLASVASIWDAEISDLTTADAPLADTTLDVEAAALTLPTPDSVCAVPSPLVDLTL